MGRAVERVCYGLLAATAAAFLVAYFVTGPYFSFQSEVKKAPNPNFIRAGDADLSYFVRDASGTKSDAIRVALDWSKGCSVKKGNGSDGGWTYIDVSAVTASVVPRAYSCRYLNDEAYGYGDTIVLPAFTTKTGELLLLTDEVIVKVRPWHDLWHIVASMGVTASRPLKDAERTYVITLSPQGHANPMERSRELFWRAEVEWAQPNFVRIWPRRD